MTNNNDTAALLRNIKQQLHGMMNGVAGASMREKGLAYRVNYGVELPRLQAFAQTLPHDYALAAALWKEDIRECRLLAGMLMPAEAFDAELAEVWIEQMRFAEEAEMTVMHLFARTAWASGKAFEWIAAHDDMHQLCGYLTLSRLFVKGMKPSERDANEIADQARAALACAAPAVRRAAARCLVRLEDMGLAAVE